MSTLKAVVTAGLFVVFCLVGLRTFSCLSASGTASAISENSLSQIGLVRSENELSPATIETGRSKEPLPSVLRASKSVEKGPKLRRNLAAEVPLGKLIGLTAQNPDGQDLGKLQDLIIDSRSGRVCYGVIASGGFLGLGRKLKIAPATAISTRTIKRGTVELAISRCRWHSAPAFDPEDLPALNQPARARGILQYYRQLEYSKGSHRAGIQTGRQPPINNRGSGSGALFNAGSLELASEVLGQTVRDRGQQVLGAISDLLVDPRGGQAAVALLTSGHFLHRRHLLLAFPALRPGPDHELVFNAGPDASDPATTLEQQASTKGESPWSY